MHFFLNFYKFFSQTLDMIGNQQILETKFKISCQVNIKIKLNFSFFSCGHALRSHNLCDDFLLIKSNWDRLLEFFKT